MANINTEKGFNTALAAIRKSGEALAQYIHNAGMFALEQVNQHGNDGFAVRLLDAMGKKHDAKRVEKWLCHFGKLQMKKGLLVYRARKDITPENFDSIMVQADNTPYWELTEQEHHAYRWDGMALLEGIVKRYTTATEKKGSGEEVVIDNADVFEEVQALITKHKAAAAAKVAAALQAKTTTAPQAAE